MFFLILLIILSVFLYKQNNDIVINNINYYNSNIPSNFDDFKILQISDLHTKEFGEDQNKLLQITRGINPDIIVITGDFIDKRRTTLENMNISICYAKGASEIASVYFVTGNHEISAKEVYLKLREEIKKYNVVDLNDKFIKVEKDGQSINLIGLNNISSINIKDKNKQFNKFEKKLSNLKDKNFFTILLSHRPDLISVYSKNNVDLVFCGHAHGGQIRLPLIGGLFAPNQGFLPRYTQGLFKKNNTSMVVSRGLGNSRFPFRIFNKPEVVVVTLKSKNN